MFMMSKDYGNVSLFVVITYICLGHTHVLFVHLKKRH